jgi:PhnB protein
MPQTIVPFIAYENAAEAIDWLTRAFGFRENRQARMTGDDGTIGHAELDVGDGSVIFLATPSPHYESPKRHRAHCEAAAKWSDNPWVIDGYMVQVDDVDAHHARAVAVGAVVLRAPEDVEGAGIRLWSGEDVEGHRWMFTQPLARK